MLILLGLPIGNLSDASPNVINTLNLADVIAAEDTRKYFRIADQLGISKNAKVISYHDSSEVERANELIRYLEQGLNVVVLTDAGMPTISDPGYRIVNAAITAGHRVTAIPGPSAVTTALALSGLATDRFCFEGFLSRKSGERKQQLIDLAVEKRTMVFFEAPHRLKETLLDMKDAFGADRSAVICRELTKTYEEVVRGTLNNLLEWSDREVLGEITIVVAGAGEKPLLDLTQIDDQAKLRELVANHPLALTDRKLAVSAIAKAFNLPKREVYDLVMKTDKQ